jgi:hypothetical protein
MVGSGSGIRNKTSRIRNTALSNRVFAKKLYWFFFTKKKTSRTLQSVLIYCSMTCYQVSTPHLKTLYLDHNWTKQKNGPYLGSRGVEMQSVDTAVMPIELSTNLKPIWERGQDYLRQITETFRFPNRELVLPRGRTYGRKIQKEPEKICFGTILGQIFPRSIKKTPNFLEFFQTQLSTRFLNYSVTCCIMKSRKQQDSLAYLSKCYVVPKNFASARIFWYWRKFSPSSWLNRATQSWACRAVSDTKLSL